MNFRALENKEKIIFWGISSKFAGAIAIQYSTIAHKQIFMIPLTLILFYLQKYV